MTVIKWNKIALNQLITAISFIQKISVQGAETVQVDILTAIGNLIDNPEKFPPDKFKLKNDESFRAFEIHNYRIAYRFKNNEIRIVRIRHFKRNPKMY
jgi:plasmid stabilization system protein ParE